METTKTITAEANGATAAIDLEDGDWNLTVECADWAGASATIEVADPGLANWHSIETFSENSKRVIFGNNDVRLNVSDYASDSIIAKFRRGNELFDLLSSGTITQQAPVAIDGSIIGPLIIGDDYTGSRQFVWNIDPGDFALGSASCRFGGRRYDSILQSSHQWLVEGAVTLDGDQWRLAFELESS